MNRSFPAVAALCLSAACARAGLHATPAPSHNMPAMDHDMSAMGSHAGPELAFLFPDGDDKGWSKLENGMQHNMAPDVPLALLPAATRLELMRQLALTMDVTKRYPTAKDAMAAGYRRAGPFMPGLGTHYVASRQVLSSGTLTDNEILHPSTIIYAGTAPDAPIAGYMYIVGVMGPTGKEPEGFAGPNDHWHYHTGICLIAGPGGSMEALGFDGSITADACRERKGNWVAATQYLLHVWTVPAYTNPLGVFAHMNPALTCGDGTYQTDSHDITNQCKVP